MHEMCGLTKASFYSLILIFLFNIYLFHYYYFKLTKKNLKQKIYREKKKKNFRNFFKTKEI